MMFSMLAARLLIAAMALVTLAPAQEPKPPFPYWDISVSYPNRQAPGVLIGGTFTKPVTGNRFPAVLLIPGAGAQDRDETIAGHKPFLVLADSLTRRGTAVLRVDDRGTARSTGNFADATTQDFASDAEAGVNYLLTRNDVDPRCIGLIGHGEGAIIAAMLAAKMPQIAFVVMLAGTAVPGEQVLLTQRERAERASHMPEAQIAADRQIATIIYKLVRKGKHESDLVDALENRPESEEALVDRWAAQIRFVHTRWLRSFLSYDPAPVLAQVKCPVLALDGAKDMDVSPDQNVPAMKAAFARGGNRDATVEVLPGLNYLFQNADTGLPMEYRSIRETMSPVALQKIAEWIAGHACHGDPAQHDPAPANNQ